MKFFLSASLVILLAGCVTSLTTSIGVQGQPAGLTGQRFTKESCKNGGWQTLKTREGASFKNQGDCVSYFAN